MIRRAAAAVAFGGAALGLWPPAASAHAVLLRTEPRAQATIAEPPAAITLDFSEPVEAAFGAIRLYNVDGKRVEHGSAVHARDGRQVRLPVGPLDNGTYTVTWRVASTDGHAISGGFAFYIGAPSTISAVPVSPEAGAGRLVGPGYAIIRFTWFAALMAIVGMVVVRRWAWTPAIAAAGLAGSEAAACFRRRFGRTLPVAWLGLMVSGALTIILQGATLSGTSLSSAVRSEILSAVLDTAFGRLWVAQMLLTVAALVPIAALSSSRPLAGVRPTRWIPVLGVGAFGLAFTAGASGHASTGATPVLTVTSVAVHLLAAGVWVGGLGALVAIGGPVWRRLSSGDRRALLRQLLPRFGRIALAAVIVVLLTGTVNSMSGLASVSDLWRVPYGRVLSGKIGLLSLALLLAAKHRYIVPGRLRSDDPEVVDTVDSFRRSAMAELAVLVVTVGLGAILVGSVPGTSLALAARGPVTQERPVGDYVAQLLIDPATAGDNEIHVTFVDDTGMGAVEVVNVSATLKSSGESAPLVMRLIAPGHFVGDAQLQEGRSYRLMVTTGASWSTTFRFRVQESESR